MQWKTLRVRAGACAVATLFLAGVLFAKSGRMLMAQSNEGSQGSVLGTWAVQVTLRDCSTDAPLGPLFNALVTCHRGETLSETPASLAFAIGQRSAGHGNWTRQAGHTYSQKMVALILFDTESNLPGTPGFDPKKPVSPGFFAGW